MSDFLARAAAAIGPGLPATGQPLLSSPEEPVEFRPEVVRQSGIVGDFDGPAVRSTQMPGGRWLPSEMMGPRSDGDCVECSTDCGVANSQSTKKDTRALSDIRVVQRIAEVLGAFGVDDPIVRPGPLARELGVQRSTLHRYLTSMANAGLLDRTPDGGYRVGPAVRRLSLLTLTSGIDVDEITRVMREVGSSTGLTVVRAVWSEVAPVVVQNVYPDTTTYVDVRVGTRLPFTAAQMQALLAFDIDHVRRDRVLSLLPIDERARLEQALARVRQQGIALGERVEEGVRAIACPVLGPDGAAMMTLAVIGTVATISDSVVSNEARHLATAADQLSRIAGFPTPHPATIYLNEHLGPREENAS